ncbi:MAG: hypothetical protein FWC73_07775 [Defluviitaleaceae bacterium]|nr:hypothetical protein [Defluviitaleaceae bacterium]
MHKNNASAPDKACQMYDSHPYNKTGACPCGDVGQYMDISKIVDAYDNATCMNSFIKKLNQISDEKIWFDEEQNMILMLKNHGGNPESDSLIGRACHCKHYNQSVEFYPKYYCKCCAEFSRPMFEPIFGKDIELSMFKTVLSGDNECITTVKINDLKKLRS